MKLDVAVNDVTLSNVGATGEFKIRNSAKAFKILSDGLYSNKIRAIIRELSCNALDSHVGAGNPDVPFEVHLPTILEPWFAVKDYGLGLDGDQIVNIYTTYFESTKTESNDFIGALGLGSKSPFSYTENFSVIAVKNGTQRIYSAYINEQGVPSIAEMSSQLTDEPNGVEVKFSVTDRSDYNSFRSEAASVFKWFDKKPVITGVSTFEHFKVDYQEKNIVPGVHRYQAQHAYNSAASIALMGNISYPLNNIPNAEKNLGALVSLLDCGLILEFDIGELDFAASREQLSYIPLTLNSIKKKLELLNDNILSHLTSQINEIDGDWKKAFFLQEKCNDALYAPAVKKYVLDTKFELFDNDVARGVKSFEFGEDDIAARNLTIQAFHSTHGVSTKIQPKTNYKKTVATVGAIGTKYATEWSIPVDKSVVIVLNDLKCGIATRARYHFNTERKQAIVYCLSHSSPDLAERQVEYDKVISELRNPPIVVKASELRKRQSAKKVSSQGIMYIRLKHNARSGNTSSYMWEPYTEEIKDDTIYHYVTLNGYQPYGKDNLPINIFDVKAYMDSCGVKEIEQIKILGVRKNRINEVKDLDNWVWFEDKLKEETAKISDTHIASLVVEDMLDSYYNKVYTNQRVANLAGPKSYYAEYVKTYGSIKRVNGSVAQLVALCGKYGKKLQVDTVKKQITDTKDNLYKRYPLLKIIVKNSTPLTEQEIADYIIMVDKLHS